MDYSQYNVKFTKKDSEIMSSYEKTVTNLGLYLGSGYEIILHSLENCNKSAKVVINGFHTNRKVGAPITDLAISVLQQCIETKSSDGTVYFTRNQKGESLKSTTIPIQGDMGKIIGLICINFYLNTPFSSLIEEWTPNVESQKFETFFSTSENTSEYLYDLLSETRAEIYGNADIPYNCKNKEIVKKLNSLGAFEIKNAVKIVSDSLGISKNTIYLHLRNAK